MKTVIGERRLAFYFPMILGCFLSLAYVWTSVSWAQSESPSGRFEEPTEGSTIEPGTALRVSTQNAEQVEFYLLNSDGQDKKYLGRGRKVDYNAFALENWSDDTLENGAYVVVAKPYNEFKNALPDIQVRVTISIPEKDPASSDHQPDQPPFDHQEADDPGKDAEPMGEDKQTSGKIIIGERPDILAISLEQVEHFDPAVIASIPEIPELSLEDVVLPEDATETPSAEAQAVLAGKGPVNSTITINLFSSPIVATTTTDENGDWVYTLEDSLGPGKHEVYITVSDEQGQTTGRSGVMSFVIGEAEASTAFASPNNSNSSTETLVQDYLWYAVGVLLLMIFVMLIAARVIFHKSPGRR